MTDFHIHVLPLMDDGAQTVAESFSMLEMLYKQGIDRVLCTPHYYGEHESAEDFLDRREQSLAKIRQEAEQMGMALAAGAEIAMWHGMSTEISERLCLGDSNLLLCELPASYAPWVIDELEELGALGYCPMIAHVDRVQALYTKEQLAAVLQCRGLVYQCNAGALSKSRVRKLMRALCVMGEQVVLGSDGHGKDYRAPDFRTAHKILDRVRMRALRERIALCDERFSEAIF